MKENNRQIKINAIIVLVLLVIIIIAGILFLILNKKLKNNLPYNDLTYDNSAYDRKLPDGFVPKKIEKCTNFGSVKIEYSVENAEEAVNYIKKNIYKYDSKNSELLKLEVVDDEDFYYSVFYSYKKTQYDGDPYTYKYTYILFKRDIIDIDNKQINLNNINDKDEIKMIFNIYNYVGHYSDKSYNIKNSNITENDDEYIYTSYFYSIVHGDWGMNDEITYYKEDIVINKKDGTYIFKNREKIDEFEGKYNPDPIITE